MSATIDPPIKSKVAHIVRTSKAATGFDWLLVTVTGGIAWHDDPDGIHARLFDTDQAWPPEAGDIDPDEIQVGTLITPIPLAGYRPFRVGVMNARWVTEDCTGLLAPAHGTIWFPATAGGLQPEPDWSQYDVVLDVGMTRGQPVVRRTWPRP